jgi:hypothetical protein
MIDEIADKDEKKSQLQRCNGCVTTVKRIRDADVSQARLPAQTGVWFRPSVEETDV